MNIFGIQSGCMIPTVIIDDEPNIRSMIADLLGKYCPGLIVAGQAENVQSGIALIRSIRPGLVLLDIRMPDGSGFDLLEHFPEPDFRVIFVTAYEEYALQAIKCSAIDYLLKPVDPDELVQAVEKAIRVTKSEFLLKMNTFFDHIHSANDEEKKIVLKTSDQIFIVKTCDIIHCDSDQNYTEFCLSGGRKIIVSRSIGEFEEILTPYRFFRVHKSHLINLDHIESFEKTDGGTLYMTNGDPIPVASRKYSELMDIFGKI